MKQQFENRYKWQMGIEIFYKSERNQKKNATFSIFHFIAT